MADHSQASKLRASLNKSVKINKHYDQSVNWALGAVVACLIACIFTEGMHHWSASLPPPPLHLFTSHHTPSFSSPPLHSDTGSI
jgi:hypothetical protein